MKNWQHGFELDDLAAVEALYQQYNERAASVFSQVKKHVVARLLHEKRLIVLGGRAAYSRTVAKVRSPIVMYQDIIVGTRQPGDLVYAHLAGAPELIESALLKENGTTAWAIVNADDLAMTEMIVRSGFRRVGTKVTTFAEVLFVYLREVAGTSLFEVNDRVSVLDAAETVHIKQLASIDAQTLAPLIDHVQQLDASTFTNHYSNYNQGKSWSALSLRGFLADPAFIAKPIEMSKDWKQKHGDISFTLQNTPLLDKFPEVHDVLAAIGAHLNGVERVRLMALKPHGGELTRHTDQVDPFTGASFGQNARVHIPIMTNPDCIFSSWSLDNVATRVHMAPGEVWYLDTRKPHTAINAGATRRVHLVIDVFVTEYFRERLVA